jgi:nucleotide-binding universal stress UspA family protein
VRRIVVGVNGSATSVAALRWALDLGAQTCATVEAVIAWQHPSVELGGSAEFAADPPLESPARRSAREHLDRAVSAAVLGQPCLCPLVRSAVEGPTAKVLVDLAADTDLLVVGSRGRGELAATVLGSVSQQCVHHATVPVAVIPSERLARPSPS